MIIVYPIFRNICLDTNRKEGKCTLYQNAMRSENVSKSKLTLAEEVIFFVFMASFFFRLGLMPAMHTVIFSFVMVNGVIGYLKENNNRLQPSLPTPGAAAKTLVQAGHVTLSKIYCSVWWGKYQITCFHIQAIRFKCKEREV